MAKRFLVVYLMFLFLQSKLCLCSLPPLLLSLKTQTTPSPPKSPAKISFKHNVTLSVSLTVGTPPQNVSLVLDTGSELSYLNCKKSPTIKFTFDSLHSTTYTPIPCSSSTCTSRTRDLTLPPSCDSNKLCHVTLSYADASSSEGNLAFETFRIAGTTLPATVFGCMDASYSTSQEEDSKYTGLLGMNRGSLSFISQMGFSKFSYCISDRDSSGVLLFGESDSITWLKPLSYTPLVQISTPLPYYNRVAYTVNLEGIRVGKKILALPKSVFVPDHTGAGQTMVDSGSQFTFLLGPVYTALKNEFLEQTKRVLTVLNEPNYVFQNTMDLCYLVPTNTNIPVLPTVSLMFRGAEMSVVGTRLLYQTSDKRGGNDIYCFTFGNSDLLGAEAYIIGHYHQHNMWVEFDLKNSRMGFAPIRCDVASQRLGMGP